MRCLCRSTPTSDGAGRLAIDGTARSNRSNMTLLERAVDDGPVAKSIDQAATPEPILPRHAVELRTIERRQLFIDGKPVGEPFE